MNVTLLRMAGALALGIIGIGTTHPAAARVTKVRPPRAFPYVITAPGTYILDDNLVVPDASTTAIDVQSDNVTIDLNGFTIEGPVVCSTPNSCTPTPTSSGIIAAGYNNVRVSNGTVRGFLDAVRLTGTMERVEGVTALSNAGIGIYIDSGVVSDCIVALNGEQGIWAAGDYSRIDNCIAMSNGQQGIEVNRAVLTGNVAVDNIEDGIKDSSGFGHISGNVANHNSGAGIYTDMSVVLGNVTVDNAGSGLDAFDCAYGFNYLTGNDSGGPQGAFSSIEVGANACGGDNTCP